MDLHSGMPFWLIKNGLPVSYLKLEKSVTTDVAVLGGGISGALTGYHLTNAGVEHVVVDSRTIGLGSTCASTALLQYEIDVPLSELIKKVGYDNAVRAYQLGVESIKKLKQIAVNLNFDEFDDKSSLYFAASKKDSAFLKEEHNARKQIGIDVELLGSKEIHSEFNISADSAILSSQAAQMNPYTFTHALHQYSIARGARVFDRTRIIKIIHDHKGVTLRSENGHTLTAKKLVYATGYEVVELLNKKIVNLQSTFATISEQASELNSLWKNDVLIWNTADPYLYMRTTKDRRMIIGGRDEPFYNPAKRDDLIGKKGSQLVKDFHRMYPDTLFKPEFTWAGTFGSTKDGLPFIGPYKKLPNSYFALGFGGNGITFSLIAAQIITDLVLGKTNSDVELFSFNRL